MLIATKTWTRYALLLSLLFLFLFLLHHTITCYDNHELVHKWRSQLRDRFAVYEVRVVHTNYSNSSVEAGMLEYARTRLAQPRNTDDLFELGMRLRAVKGYLESAKENPYLPYKHYTNSSEFGSVYEMLEQELFGWAVGVKFKSLFDLRDSMKPGRCLVIPTGTAYFKFAVHIIRSVREVYKSEMPIFVYYLGSSDLSADKIAHLSRYHGVTVVDITTVFNDKVLHLHGWDIKPFAMLAAPFEEVMLMDADSVLLQPPESFFADQGYQQEGALFFHDRTLFPTDHHKQEWVRGLMARPLSSRLVNSRYYKMQTTYEQEAGVVLVNKRRHFGAMLAVCRLNCPPERDDIIHKETHGDKETFWMGFEMVGSNYSFMPSMPGSIGRVQPDYETKEPAICGKLAHFDRHGELLWFNDSIVDNKQDKEWSEAVAELTHYGKEGKWTPYLCLHSEKIPLSVDQLELIGKLKKVYTPRPC